MKQIQFCSGENQLEGWENYDQDCNLDNLPLPFEDSSADQIFIEHGLEHFDISHGLRLLEEFRRILKPGGVLRICVPVVGVHLKREHAKDLMLGHGHKVALDRNITITALWAAGFELSNIKITPRREIDGHFRAIGKEADDIETLRIEAHKTIPA
jgi:predicted SAM-dependent methyltransferase